MKTKVLSIIATVIGTFCIAGFLAACNQTATKESPAQKENALIGSWQTLNGPPTIYSFQDNHTFAITYKGGPVLEKASKMGHWKLDADQLTIVTDKRTAGDGREMPPLEKGESVTWNIMSVSESAMVWRNVSFQPLKVELKLSRIKSAPAMATKEQNP